MKIRQMEERLENTGLADAFLRGIFVEKTSDEIVADAQALERLLGNKDFLIYRRMLIEGYVRLVKRLQLSGVAELPALQGALIQHEALIKLPEKIIETAARVVAQSREKEHGEAD